MGTDRESETEDLKQYGNQKENIKFEDVIDVIGHNGKFQKQMNLVFNCFSVFSLTMSSYTKFLALSVPDHWCHVPGRGATNLSESQWKAITIPKEDGSYSKCTMYTMIGQQNETSECENGWEYDDTWLYATVASRENWVCGKRMYPNNVMSIALFISVVFGILLFYIGDRFGRKKQYFLCLTSTSVFRSLLVASTSVYPLYIALSVLPEAAHMPCTESALAVGIELSGVKQRSTINFMSLLSASIGILTFTLIAWISKHWIYFMIIPSFLCFIPLFFYRLFPESPRWLVAKGHPEKAYGVLRKIAEKNGNHLEADTLKKLRILSKNRSPDMGIKSFFTHKMIFRNTLLLLCGRAVSGFTTFTLFFTNRSFGGNPFLALLGQGLLQMPAISTAHFLGDRFGRRCTHCFILLFAVVVSAAVIAFITITTPQWMVTAGSMILIFCSQSSMSLTNLQSMEIHPTGIRQISMAFEYIVLTIVLCTCPYVAFLGTEFEIRYVYAIITSALLFGSIVMSFLPESLNENLPETLEDASQYGRGQKYWSLPKKLNR